MGTSRVLVARRLPWCNLISNHPQRRIRATTLNCMVTEGVCLRYAVRADDDYKAITSWDQPLISLLCTG